MRFFKLTLLFLLIVFILPASASLAWWWVQERPAYWRYADWSVSGVLPAPADDPQAAIYVMAARTGGMKGAFFVHSWLVLKRANAPGYDRYEKSDRGSLVRRNAHPADARGHYNTPYVLTAIKGKEAERLIPQVEEAIVSYYISQRGDYSLWPGPNSNSFTAHVLRTVPDLNTALPPTAIGRDYRPGLFAFDHAPDWSDVHVSFGGLAGFTAGVRSGFELQFLGLVAGLDIRNPALKVPGFGRVELWPSATAGEKAAPST